MVEDFRLVVGETGDSLHLQRRTAGVAQPRSLVVLSHGFTGSGSGPHRTFLRLGDALNAAGHDVLTFDYRGSGYSDGAHEDMTISQEIADLQTVVEYVREKYHNVPLGLFGNSLGATIISLVLAKTPDVRVAVLWAGLYDITSKFNARIAAQEGWVDFGDRVCSPKGYMLKKSFLADAATHDPYAQMKGCLVPTLLVHGTADASVPLAQSERLSATLSGPQHFLQLPEGTHTFECQPELEKQLRVATVDWFTQYLK